MVQWSSHVKLPQRLSPAGSLLLQTDACSSAHGMGFCDGCGTITADHEAKGPSANRDDGRSSSTAVCSADSGQAGSGMDQIICQAASSRDCSMTAPPAEPGKLPSDELMAAVLLEPLTGRAPLPTADGEAATMAKPTRRCSEGKEAAPIDNVSRSISCRQTYEEFSSPEAADTCPLEHTRSREDTDDAGDWCVA